MNREFQQGADYSSIAATGDVLTAPVVFVGYGLADKDAKYDDFKDIDIKGKIVMVLSSLAAVHPPQAPARRRRCRSWRWAGWRPRSRRLPSGDRPPS